MGIESWEDELFDRWNREYVSEDEYIADLYDELEEDLKNE